MFEGIEYIKSINEGQLGGKSYVKRIKFLFQAKGVVLLESDEEKICKIREEFLLLRLVLKASKEEKERMLNFLKRGKILMRQ